MSINLKSSSFLADPSVSPAASFQELDIPPDATGERNSPVQPYACAAGSQLAIYSHDRRKVSYCVVRSRDCYGQGGYKFMVQDTLTSEVGFLSDWQLSVLEMGGRLVPLQPSQWQRKPKQHSLRSFLTLEPDERRAAMRRARYAQALLAAKQGGEVLLTKSLVLETATKLASARGETKPPCYNSLMRWLRKYEENPFNRLLALAEAKSSGNTVRKFDSRLEDVIATCVQWAWEMPAGTSVDAFEQLKPELAKPENKALLKDLTDEDGTINLPSFRTVQRRFLSVDRYTRDLWRYGPEYARRKHTIYTARQLPDHVLGLVEVDYTTGDVVVYDDEMPFLYGRPHVLFFIDKKSGSILGFAVHFDNPSFEAFVYGLRRAIYPKDMSEFPGLSWNQYGLPVAMVVDNATFFISDAMVSLCQEVGIALVENLPGEPTGKGSVERMFRALNEKVFHKTRGTTHSNPSRRKLFDDSKGLGKPVITLRQLEQFITLWIADYHSKPRRGIGRLPKMKAVPNEVWEAGLKDLRARDLIDPDIFVSSAGQVTELTIQNDGVTWNYITYSSPDLLEITAHPNHKSRKPGVESSRYKVIIDPSNLVNAWIVNPYKEGRVIKMTAAGPCFAYAGGLRLFQHRKTIEHHNKVTRKPVTTIHDLETAKRTYTKELAELHDIKKLQRTGQALSKFHAQLTRKHKRTAIVNVVESAAASAEHFDLSAPFAPHPKRQSSLTEARDGTPERLVRVAEDCTIVEDDPLEAQVAEHKRRGRPRTEKSGPRVQPERTIRPTATPALTDDDDLNSLLEQLGYKE